MSNSDKPRPWVTIYDKYGDDNGVLTGNQKGLEILKHKIDEAIEKGEIGTQPELEGDFIEVRKEEKRPDLEEEKETMKDEAMRYGCIAFGLLLLIIFGFGIKGIYDIVFVK